MTFKLRIRLLSRLLSRNLPVLMIATVIGFSFNCGIFFDQAVSGWMHHDRL